MNNTMKIMTKRYLLLIKIIEYVVASNILTISDILV